MRIVSILFLTIMLAFLTFLFVQKSVQADTILNDSDIVRGFVWGVSNQDVFRFEKGKFLKSEKSNLFYSDTLYERASTVGYQFEQDRLIRVRIDIHGRTPNPQDWITLLMDAQQDLNKKWGKPSTEDFFWRNDLEKDFPDNWGFAVLKGDLAIQIKWIVAGTQVTMILDTVEKLTPVLTIFYEKIMPEQNHTPKIDVNIAPEDVLSGEPAPLTREAPVGNSGDLLALP